MHSAAVEKKIEDFIERKVGQAGAEGAVLGLSGGLDSAVAATLCARALGPGRVLALIMPSPSTSHHDTETAGELASSLKIRSETIPLDSILDAFAEHLEPDRRAMGNLAARVRMALLYYRANRMGLLVVGTGNKSELSIGYFTKHGDGGCDILPLGDLYKTEVRELARHLKLPKDIIEKEPSAGLWKGQTDEGEIGMSYEELDRALKGESESERVEDMIKASDHKRNPPEVCRI